MNVQYRVLHSSEAQIGSLIMLLEPVFGVFFAWLFFKEVIGISAVLGGGLILLGAALPNFLGRNES